MIVPGRQLEFGEGAVAEVGGERRVAADQRGGGEAMPLGLHDMMVADRADLTDRAVERSDEIGGGERAHAGAHRAGEEVVGARVAGEVGGRGFAHVDAVFAREPADEAGGHGAAARAGDAAGEAGEGMLGEQMLRQDLQAIGRGEPRAGAARMLGHPRSGDPGRHSWLSNLGAVDGIGQ